MDLIALRAFFFWCTVINGAVLLAMPVIFIFAFDWASSIHCSLFKVSKEMCKTMFYCFIFLYKIFWMIFNFVPWLALLIIA
jgi:hypothetical protein